MHILFFGTFDERTHPRVRVLREGLADHGFIVDVCNAPLGLATSDRVAIARRIWRVPVLLARIAVGWARLLSRARGRRPDVVVVGYLGHFDVHLARWRFRRARIVLDHMVGLGDTIRDRNLDDRGRLAGALDAVDRAALKAADIILVDTEEQRALVPAALRHRTVVVAVGAPRSWSAARRGATPHEGLRVAFYGLFTPLQGTPTIGAALRALHDDPIVTTMVGTGQDLAATRAAVGDDPSVTWIEWLSEPDLVAAVADHDVCLGIFGDGPKARRVVPNKVYQGAAAGCAVVTSDTEPQRRVLGSAARYVPAGDADALASMLRQLAHDPDAVRWLRDAAADRADQMFTPSAVVAPLVARLGWVP